MDKSKVYNYHVAFTLIKDDLTQLGQYVEITEANLKVYSHKLYQLLLKICIEFESICKDALEQIDYEKPSKKRHLNCNDYKILYEKYEANHRDTIRYRVLPKHWIGEQRWFYPFEGWENDSSLSWYQSYNLVKHNREKEFHHASLENVLLAYGAYCCLMTAYCGYGSFAMTDTRYGQSYSTNGRKLNIAHCPFVLEILGPSSTEILNDRLLKPEK